MLASRLSKSTLGRAAVKASSAVSATAAASFHASAARRAMKFDPTIGLTDEQRSIQVRPIVI